MSDSPPPLIVKSNIRQTARRGRAFQPGMTTQQRLRAAIQASKEDTSNTSQAHPSARDSTTFGKSFAPIDLGTGSQSTAQSSRSSLTAAAAAAPASGNGSVFPPFYRHPPTGIASSGLLVPSSGQISGHGILLRQVVGQYCLILPTFIVCLHAYRAFRTF